MKLYIYFSYKKHLGLPVDDWGASFAWRDKDNPDQVCYTAWSPFPADTKYFEPAKREFMFIGWILDPEGNKIELWEPVDEKLDVEE